VDRSELEWPVLDYFGDDEYAAIPLGLWPLCLEAVDRQLPTTSRQANVFFHLLQGPAGVLNSIVEANIVE
jgi:hypothetical protein